jgi:hypothetical protein
MIFATAILVYYFIVVKVFPAIAKTLKSVYRLVISDLSDSRHKSAKDSSK